MTSADGPFTPHLIEPRDTESVAVIEAERCNTETAGRSGWVKRIGRAASALIDFATDLA